jgi:hypothetical protein
MLLLVSAGVSAAPPEPVLNAKVVAFAKKNVGKQVGDGECSALAVEALKSVGAKPFGSWKDSPGEGDYVWGSLVYGFGIKDGIRSEDVAIGTTIQPGDIVQYRDAEFQGKSPNGGTYKASAPHHTSVVLAVKNNGKSLVVLEQNTNGRKTVGEGTIHLSDLQSGWVKVYRPVKP